MKINIIMDNKDNWYYKRVPKLIKSVRNLNHVCRFVSSKSKISNNSDISFFLGHEAYIKEDDRKKSKYNIVVHASDLPKGKGMSPSTWQIIEGKNKIPVTLFEVAEGFDTGDYYLKDSFTLRGDELIDEWQDKLGNCIDKMILKFLKDIRRIRPIKQKGKSFVYRRRTPEDSELNINKSIKSQFNLLRVVDNNNYPAFFRYKGCRYIIKIYKD